MQVAVGVEACLDRFSMMLVPVLHGQGCRRRDGEIFVKGTVQNREVMCTRTHTHTPHGEHLGPAKYSGPAKVAVNVIQCTSCRETS